MPKPNRIEMERKRSPERMKQMEEEHKAYMKGEAEGAGRMYREAERPVRKSEAGRFPEGMLQGLGEGRDMQIHKQVIESMSDEDGEMLKKK